ncbi:hypothetical protein H5T87_04795 [bacterium]|nr:hypothetical protein [bacterium]
MGTEIFVSEEITVNFEKKPGPPSSFIWRKRHFNIVKCKFQGRKLDFGKRWWQRHHKDYYIVEDDKGNVFQIYYNRGPRRRYWVLFKILRVVSEEIIAPYI